MAKGVQEIISLIEVLGEMRSVIMAHMVTRVSESASTIENLIDVLLSNDSFYMQFHAALEHLEKLVADHYGAELRIGTLQERVNLLSALLKNMI